MEIQTIEEGKKFLEVNFDKGVSCPCCKQFVKLYRRRITGSMARALISMYQFFREHPEQEWVSTVNYLHVPDVVKFKYWEILEAKEGERDDGSKRVGWYKLTEKGRQFVEGSIRVPARVYLYNQKFYGFSPEEIGIQNTFKNQFDYSELMKK